MKDFTYGICEKHYSFDNKSRISYGIVAYADGDTDGIAAIIASVRDISPDKPKYSSLQSS